MTERVRHTAAVTHPDRALLFLNYADAERYTAASAVVCWFLCPNKGHVWDAPVKRVIYHGQNCPFCAGKRVLVGFNDIATTHPERAHLFADTEDAQRYTAASHKRSNFRCDLGHDWESIISNTIRAENNCPFCTRQRILVGFNDVATTHPERVHLFADPADAQRYMASSGKRSNFRCDLGHNWTGQISTTIGGGKGCWECHVVRIGFNDVATTHPERVYLFTDPEDAHRFVAGSSSIRKFCCPLGHTWKACIRRVFLENHGCHVCMRKVVLHGFNDIATTHPHLVQYFVNPIDAMTHTSGSRKSLQFVCPEKHEWISCPRDIVNAGGCPGCSSGGGYDVTRTGFFYLLLDMINNQTVIHFGISNVLEKRLREHSRSGFHSPPILVVKGSGGVVLSFESQVKRKMKSMGIQSLLVQGIQFKNKGASEAFYLNNDLCSDFFEWIKEMAQQIEELHLEMKNRESVYSGQAEPS